MSDLDPTFHLLGREGHPGSLTSAPAVADFIEAEGRTPRHDPPWLVVNMISSVDGAMAVDGLSGGLGGPADKIMFRALRGVADAILVGAGTARAEGYGPPILDDTARARRVERGAGATPVLAIVTRSARLDPESRLFVDAERPPIVYVSAGADPERCAALGEVAEVVNAGDERGVDPTRVLADLGARGNRTVLAEGGPSLNGDLFAAGAVDELCLSLSPVVVSGTSGRIVTGADGGLSSLRLDRVLQADDMLFLRYVLESPWALGDPPMGESLSRRASR